MEGRVFVEANNSGVDELLNFEVPDESWCQLGPQVEVGPWQTTRPFDLGGNLEQGPCVCQPRVYYVEPCERVRSGHASTQHGSNVDVLGQMARRLGGEQTDNAGPTPGPDLLVQIGHWTGDGDWM